MSETREARTAEDEARWRAWLEIARWESGECLEQRLGSFLDGALPTGTTGQDSDRPGPALSPIVAGRGER
jgi:hypothetical protein